MGYKIRRDNNAAVRLSPKFIVKAVIYEMLQVSHILAGLHNTFQSNLQFDYHILVQPGLSLPLCIIIDQSVLFSKDSSIKNLITKIFILQRQLQRSILQHRYRLLKIVSLLARYTNLVALNSSLNFDFAVFN